LLVARAPDIAATAQPGQFVSLRVTEGMQPLLRRPFSLHSVDRSDGNILILYWVVGTGTELLSHARPGQPLDVMGPLGNGFRAASGDPVSSGGRCILVGGGSGLAPLLFLAETLTKEERPPMVVLGGRSARHLVRIRAFERCSSRLMLATEDGTAGTKGFVTAPLRGVQPDAERSTVVYACGPVPMLRAVGELADARNWDCFVSLEAMMACGLGACLGCAVKVRRPEGVAFLRACADGPVFPAREVVWE